MVTTKEKKVKKQRPFGFRDKFSYLMGDFGCNMSFSLISGYMMLFYTQYIGVSLVHYGFIILFTKIWDAINDPLIGSLSDRFTPKSGDKFRPWIFWGSIPLAFSSCLLFLDTRTWPYWSRIVVCIVGYLIWDIAYTVVNVPYGSMNAVITSDPVERSQLSTWRSFGAMVAFIPISIFVPQIAYKKEVVNGVEHSILQGDKFFLLALGMGIIAFAAFQILYHFSTERVQHTGTGDEKFSYFRALKSFFTNRSMLAVALASLAQIMLVMSATSANSLVYQMYFGDGSLASYSVIAMVLPMILVAPLIKPMVKRFGTKNLATWPLLLTIACYLAVLIPKNISPIYFIVMNTLGALGSGFFSLLTWALVSDGIDSIEYQTGRREEGSMYATYSMVRKLGQGLGQSLIPFIFAIFIPGLDMNNSATWSMEYGLTIKNIATGLPLVGTVMMFLSFLLIYDLTPQRMATIQSALGRTNAEVNVGISDVTADMSRRED